MHADAPRPAPSSDLAANLPDWLARLAHVLPAQAPLRDFVHHNTLHGFQHLPFEQALEAAHALTGASPYWPEARYQALYADGRISADDLVAALAEVLGEAADETLLPGLTLGELLQADLLAEAVPDAARRDWERREGRLDAAIFARFSALTVQAAPAPPDWRELAARRHTQLFDRLGAGLTLGQLLEHLGCPPPFEAVRSALQRQLAAHLDLGFAAWRHPLRTAGLYAAWRNSALCDAGWDLAELPAARQDIADLPESPQAAIAEALGSLLPDTERHYDYLQTLALQLPGWSGMLLRRAGAGDDELPPLDMADYLAVRLSLERLLCSEWLRRLTGTPAGMVSPAELRQWFAERPAEFLLRDLLQRGELPETLAHRVRHLLQAPPAERTAWHELAAAAVARPQDAELPAWRLYRLQPHLPTAVLEALDAPGAARLLAASERLTPLQRGQVWLLAYERHYREQLFAALTAPGRPTPPAEVTAQVICCMDDREEGTRRHLEEIAPTVRTYGAAGFFGIAMYWQGLDDPAPSALCPVVVTPRHLLRETPAEGAEAAARRRRLGLNGWRERRVVRHEQTRLAPLRGPLLSALAAPLTLFGLLAGSLAPDWFARLQQRWQNLLAEKVPTAVAVDAELPDHEPDIGPDAERPPAGTTQNGFTLAEQVERVAAFLRTIGLTDAFAPLVLLLGHGSHSRNNPHRSAYACGACSGRHGGPNARVFATLANRPAVREALAAQGIAIPPTTLFLAAEHDTCDDAVHWYDLESIPAEQQPAVDRLVGQLAEACRAHAAERCRRFASAPPDPAPWQAWQHVRQRAADFGQARPELGHATNAAALIGRRAMSRGLFLDRRAFLISYDPTDDTDGAIAESILLAAGPVGAGINLEYYFSTVDNERFGCGSKITHNITGLFGVMEGADSDLRTGLPLQMVEIHEPMRLLVVVEQTPAVLSAILARQPALRELVDNGWIVFAAFEPSTVKLHLYSPQRGWEAWAGGGALPRVARSRDWFGGQHEALAPAVLLGAAT